MRVVIDTNVLVSAALRDRGPERVILAVVERSDLEWMVSVPILREYRDVLSRPKFALSGDLLEQWFRILDAVTTCVDVQGRFDLPRDPSNAKFWECALSSGAEFLITGDRDFEGAVRLGNTTVSVAQFERLVLAQMG